MSERKPIRRALISVSNKEGLTDLARALHEHGVEIVSTGSTAGVIESLGIPVTFVADITGFPESLDGRVKTLHPVIHAGLLADLDNPTHQQEISELGIIAFDLVVVNLYPFTETVMSGSDITSCIENIDIGGPAMIRSAAKNHQHLAVIVGPEDYGRIQEALSHGGFSLEERQSLAAKAFTHTATYDVHVASWMGNVVAGKDNREGFPTWLGATYNLVDILRYGENPHQKAALYQSGFGNPLLTGAELLQGKAMSFNNYVDAESALRIAYDFDTPTIAIVKHANPCGIATAAMLQDAYRKALASDSLSAFGGVIASNIEIDGETAAEIVKLFTEVVVARSFSDEAVRIFQTKPNMRVLKVSGGYQFGLEMKPISGGLLLQSQDTTRSLGDNPETWKKVAGEDLSEDEFADLVFAWRAVRGVKSNAILIAKHQATVGIGMGQVNRVDASYLAVKRASDKAHGAVAASDAFFPFPDGLEILIAAGVKAVVAPSGSLKDDEVIQTARAAGITFYHTDTRHFFH